MKTLALRARVFTHCFLVFGYPGETLAFVVHILLSTSNKGLLFCSFEVNRASNWLPEHHILTDYAQALFCGPQINFYPNLVDERFSSNFICLGFGYNRRHVHHSLGLLSSTGNEGDYF